MAGKAAGGWLLRLCCASVAEGCVPGKVPGQDLPGGLEFLSDKSEPDQPGPHREFRVVDLWLFRAGALCCLRLCGKAQAKLDVAFELSGVQAVLLVSFRVCKLEEAELNRPFCEGRVEVEHMVAAVVVVLVAPVGRVVLRVPDVCEVLHGLGLFPVNLCEEVPVYRSAVAADPAMVNPDRAGKEPFVAGHQVCQVPQALRVVAGCADVDVDSAHVIRVALGSLVTEASHQLLEGLDVVVGEDRCYHLTFLFVGAGLDARVPLELPFPSLAVPGAPGFVAVAGCGVFDPAASEEGSCLFRGVLSCDVVHLDLDPNGLCFHGLDLLSGCFLHGMCSFPG